MDNQVAQQLSKKNSGSYYTPEILSDFMVKHVVDNYLAKDATAHDILEPSCGDGEFIKSIIKSTYFSHSKANVYACEIDKAESAKADNLIKNNAAKINGKVFHADFLDFYTQNQSEYDLIIGNPPYIDKRRLSSAQIEACKGILSRIGIKNVNVKNIWPIFLLASSTMIKPNGTIAFVLPAELLQVNYTLPIRQFLIDNFSKIDVFAFNELIFDNIEQDVVILVATKKQIFGQEKGISFYQVNSLNDLLIPEYVKKHTNLHRKTLNKWTNYLLSDNDLDFIDESKRNMQSIKFYCTRVEVGIVTGANHYFILNEDQIKENSLQDHNEKILTRGGYISNVFCLNSSSLNQLQDKKKPHYLFRTLDVSREKLDIAQINYIDKGINMKVSSGYKCAKRSNWYCVPSIWRSTAIFIKRTNLYPRIILNDIDILVTDSFYRIETAPQYDARSLAFSFYNTISFIAAELEGRYYGGGVLELTPNEFKNLPIPYNTFANEEQINYLHDLIASKAKIDTILDYTDNLNLIGTYGLSQEDVTRLRKIYKTLINRRLKKKSII